MNIWFRYSDEILVCAPEVDKAILNIDEAYQHDRINFYKVPSIEFTRTSKILASILKLPKIIWEVFKVMRKADHIHLRCPGNISLLGCLIQIFFPAKPKSVKYAGNWSSRDRQPFSYTFQRWILSNTFLTRNAVVLVYGEWPHQSKNVKSFFTASFQKKEVLQVKEKNFDNSSFIFLFVGSLVPGKQPMIALKLFFEIQKEINCKFIIYGDGDEREKMKEFCRKNGLEGRVIFKGNSFFEEVRNGYQNAHFLILPSVSEGWPKAVAEAMFYGCIPITSKVSCLPHMLDHGNRGIINSFRSESDIYTVRNQVRALMNNKTQMEKMSMASRGWSQQYSLEKLEEGIKEIMKKE